MTPHMQNLETILAQSIIYHRVDQLPQERKQDNGKVTEASSTWKPVMFQMDFLQTY